MNLNITIELLRKFSSSKQMKELLAVALWMKMQHRNGVVWNVTSSMLRKRLHIGKVKAHRLLADMKQSDLFEVVDGIVSVRSFRDRSIKWNRKGKVYHGAMVCKFKVNADYTLKELYSLINEKLFEYPICAMEHKDCCSKEYTNNNSSAKGKFITTNQFQKIINMGRGSVARIKKRMVTEGKVIATIAKQFSFDTRNAEETINVLRKTGRKQASFCVGDLGYIVLPCAYVVVDRDITNSFRHLIYGKQNQKTVQSCVNIAGLPDGFYA